ncbi:MAG: hypothetical protein R2809_01025 [Flavobacteriales bacterium]
MVYTITGTNGCSASENILVSNITNPAVGAGIDGGTQGCAPLDICFNILNFANNHESTTYVVNFGDGSPLQNLNHPPPPQIYPLTQVLLVRMAALIPLQSPL